MPVKRPGKDPPASPPVTSEHDKHDRKDLIGIWSISNEDLKKINAKMELHLDGDGKGKVMMLRYIAGHGSTQPRESGFIDAIRKFPGIEIVSADRHSGATLAEAEAAAKTLVAKFGGELAGVYTPNQTSTTGMLHALRESLCNARSACSGHLRISSKSNGL